jgi:hypothetical protein
MFNSKGQSALEYLMTYGWALVVIVIVIAALFAFGVFNTPKQCTQTGGQLLVKAFDFNSNVIQLKVQNGSTDTITITGFAGDPEPITSWYGSEGDPTVDMATGSALARTDTNTFFLSTSLSGNIAEEITITYTSGGMTKTEKTTCSGPV